MQVRKYEILNLSEHSGRLTRLKESFPSSIHVPLSAKNEYTNEKPLKLYSRELSFKGFSLGNVKVKNASKVLDKVGDVLGDTFKTKFTELQKSHADRIIKDGDTVEFVRKSITSMTLESLAYPFVKMPFDLLDFGLSVMKKVPFLKKPANSLYNSNFLTGIRNKALKDEEFNSVMGMFDQVSKKMESAKPGSNIDEWIFGLSQKFFNPEKGKYNSVHERSLNRIVSGMIPAFFLANDAYNLSRFCDDNPQMAEKEHKTRFKQEVSRVGITAYIQLVLLGGLTKFVNGNLWGTAMASTIPVLIAETSSRLMNGKSITFISKEKAKQMAQEQGVIGIKDDKSNDADKVNLIYKYYPMPVAFTRTDRTFMAFRGKNTSAFSSFAPQNVVDQTAGIVGMVTAKRDQENRLENKKSKGLLSITALRNAIITSIAAGFGIKYARKNAAVDKAMKSFFGVFKDNYNKIVKQDFYIKKSDFADITAKLEEAGFKEIAQRYQNLMQTHEAETQKLADLLREMLAKMNTEKFAQMAGENKELLKKYNIKSTPVAVKEYFNEIKNTPENAYRLAKVDKKIKPAVDFVIAPFKFMWATVKFPYTIVNNIVKVATGSTGAAKKQESAIATVTKSLQDMSEHAKKLSAPEFKEYIERTMCSSFNNTTKSDYSNADLGKLTKLFASTVTTWFLIADDYNMVMMKSLGQDSAGAALKAKERFQQRITGIFYQTLFIDLFNNTFRKLYHASLLGMSAVTGACTVVCEVFTRKSIGKPVGQMSRDEINALEYQNNHAPGLKGKYFRFMTDLTGKKAVSVDVDKKKKINAAA